jgi:hypothetical protein
MPACCLSRAATRAVSATPQVPPPIPTCVTDPVLAPDFCLQAAAPPSMLSPSSVLTPIAAQLAQMHQMRASVLCTSPLYSVFIFPVILPVLKLCKQLEKRLEEPLTAAPDWPKRRDRPSGYDGLTSDFGRNSCKLLQPSLLKGSEPAREVLSIC